MEKYFICLANSYKNGERCIAGVEVLPREGFPLAFRDISYSGRKKRIPNWIRPVARGGIDGEIPCGVASKIKPFDIVKLTGVEECPCQVQRENCYYSTMEIVATKEVQEKILSALASRYEGRWLFGNKGKAIPAGKEEVESLMLIRPKDVEFYINGEGKTRVKFKIVDFSRETIEYDLPVTDPCLCKHGAFGLNAINSYNDYYFTVSLTKEKDSWHYKIVANVFSFNQRELPSSPIDFDELSSILT